jgi:hypothetical protein
VQYTATIEIELELTHGVLLGFLCDVIRSGKYVQDEDNEMVIGTVRISAMEN